MSHGVCLEAILKSLGQRYSFKDTHREKAPSNQTPASSKCTNIGIWVVDTSNQLFIKGSEIDAKFSTKLIIGKTPFLVIGPFCTHHCIYLNIDF